MEFIILIINFCILTMLMLYKQNRTLERVEKLELKIKCRESGDNPLKESLEEFNKTVEEYNKFLRDSNRKIETKIDESIKLMKSKDEIKG
ncbi:MAG: hypothetical protein ACLR60_03555 [Clostridium paraputrificum]